MSTHAGNRNIPAAPASNGTLGSISIGTVSQASANNGNNGNNDPHAKQRRREKRAAKSESNSGKRTQALKPPRRKRSQLEEGNASSKRGGGGGSELWTILMIGLVFCLVDVVYIMGFVDRHHVLVVPESRTSIVGTSDLQQLPDGVMPVADSQRVLESFSAKAKEISLPGQHLPAGVVESFSSKAKRIPPPPPTGHKYTKAADRLPKPPKTKDLGQVRDKIDGILNAENPNGNSNNDKPEPVDPFELYAKARILELIREAGVHIDIERDADIIRELPTWKQVTDLYGEKPVIHGLDTCQKFQDHSDRADHFVSTAGTFNSGTNLMAELLIANCHMQDRMEKYGATNRGVRWQVPWGKHTPPGDEKFRQSHKTHNDGNVDASNILPAVTIRDPLFWLHSMCKHPYTAKWDHLDGDQCPDFNPDNNLKTKVKYAGFYRNHDSILHHWNDYYNEYLNADFPRLLVRYEDLLFHPKELTKSVCECAGGSMRRDDNFIFIVDTAKKGDAAHGSMSARTGYVDAMIKYGSEEKRYEKYVAKRDLEYIRDHVDTNLMTLLSYPAADPDKLQNKSPVGGAGVP